MYMYVCTLNSPNTLAKTNLEELPEGLPISRLIEHNPLVGIRYLALFEKYIDDGRYSRPAPSQINIGSDHHQKCCETYVKIASYYGVELEVEREPAEPSVLATVGKHERGKDAGASDVHMATNLAGINEVAINAVSLSQLDFHSLSQLPPALSSPVASATQSPTALGVTHDFKTEPNNKEEKKSIVMLGPHHLSNNVNETPRSVLPYVREGVYATYTGKSPRITDSRLFSTHSNPVIEGSMIPNTAKKLSVNDATTAAAAAATAVVVSTGGVGHQNAISVTEINNETWLSPTLHDVTPKIDRELPSTIHETPLHKTDTSTDLNDKQPLPWSLHQQQFSQTQSQTETAKTAHTLAPVADQQRSISIFFAGKTRLSGIHAFRRASQFPKKIAISRKLAIDFHANKIRKEEVGLQLIDEIVMAIDGSLLDVHTNLRDSFLRFIKTQVWKFFFFFFFHSCFSEMIQLFQLMFPPSLLLLLVVRQVD
ncbi:hypothetical protein RFI_08787 [Reticulomyxa filosa]|uniref:Uncharacterized protein n=1 Tax=Reticulomyxa filosa TaxID=46433 RepID=X6NPX3_RETFI|nr:hypothetical protein RFI_08787 [Reticulomyxa filosa]|eukprot:ETO28345.1 hypothetical protein RFI_08787 [Reticulomyxa filosa]